MFRSVGLTGVETNFVKQLGVTVNAASRLQKGGPAKTYQEMYSLANRLAFSEATAHTQVHSSEALAGQVAAAENKKLVSRTFLDHLTERREYHLGQMFRLLKILPEPEMAESN